MARSPLDQISQRQLLFLLRVDIARAMLGDSRASRRALELALDNPHSWNSTFVQYNLGKRKFAWLAGAVATRTQRVPRRRDASNNPLVGPGSSLTD